MPAHILLSLLQQGDEGIAVVLLDAVGADRTAPSRRRALVSALPSATGGDGPKPQLSRQGPTVMQTAQKVAAERGDEYISTEHVLIALSKDGGTEVTSALAAQGATRMRSTHSAGSRCNSRNLCRSGGHVPALEKFGVDLTARAEEGLVGSRHRT